MALKYEINMFETDSSDASKTFVTFVVKNDKEQTFVVSRSVTTASKTDEQICTEAQAAAQSEIDTWASQVANIVKTWNPDTNKIE